MTNCTYLLPIRRVAFSLNEAAELRDYMSILQAAGCEVLVVDGSPQPVFAEHENTWRDVCRHQPVDLRFKFLNDKVNGIHTGVGLATTEKIILADDDIRYTKIDIERISDLLEQFEVVRPQNYLAARWNDRSEGVAINAASPPNLTSSKGLLDPPWAKMEAARMLINRATLRGADYPGTCAFRKSTMLRVGGYDGDVLFDNEEIIRHFARGRARICYANDLFVRKRPPRFRKWLEQRPRQAYEDFGLRLKTVLFAALLPFAIALVFFGGIKWMSIFLLSILLAAVGRERGNARQYFPFTVCLFAPLWVFERAFSTYWAFYWFVTRGGYPFGDRILSKGIGRDWVEGGKIAASASSRE